VSTSNYKILLMLHNLNDYIDTDIGEIITDEFNWLEFRICSVDIKGL
jgi:hypothetical protein